MSDSPKPLPNIEEMDPSQIIDEIIAKIEHMFGPEPGFGGTPEEYAWLLENYGVTEEEDNTWLDIIQGEDRVSLEDSDPELEAEIRAFLDDPEAMWTFLEKLLVKYRSKTVVYPGKKVGPVAPTQA